MATICIQIEYYADKAIIYSLIYAVNSYLAQIKKTTNHQIRNKNIFIALFTTKICHNANR